MTGSKRSRSSANARSFVWLPAPFVRALPALRLVAALT
jgi:hypothetical protein